MYKVGVKSAIDGLDKVSNRYGAVSEFSKVRIRVSVKKLDRKALDHLP